MRLKELVLAIWDVEISDEQEKKITEKYPNILCEYQTQKRLFGFNMFDVRGHKPTKKLSTDIF